jgi:hypothetical protein
MRRFLIHIGLFLGLPTLVIAIFYYISDPYRLFCTFSPHNYDIRVINRDQVTTDFFLYLNPRYDYNAFIFGSSRANAINSYHWKKYLPADTRQFLFQGYGQRISGIDEKVRFLEKNGNHIEYALILIDIPGSFLPDQYPTNPVEIRDYRTSGQNKYLYHLCRFGSFLRKPSEWVAAWKGFPLEVTIDTFSNEFGYAKRTMDINVQPDADCLGNCSDAVRDALIKEMQSIDTVNVSELLIDETILVKLKSIQKVFERQDTKYKIIITPSIYPINPAINPTDLEKLETIFGKESVFNYSGNNPINTDYCNFSDPMHFGPNIGWEIIEELYNRANIQDTSCQ